MFYTASLSHPSLIFDSKMVPALAEPLTELNSNSVLMLLSPKHMARGVSSW